MRSCQIFTINLLCNKICWNNFFDQNATIVIVIAVELRFYDWDIVALTMNILLDNCKKPHSELIWNTDRLWCMYFTQQYKKKESITKLVVYFETKDFQSFIAFNIKILLTNGKFSSNVIDFCMQWSLFKF